MLLAVAASPASADKTIAEPGEGAGQTRSPQGLATDFETGRLYVADQGNNRIDAFDSAGTFELAFGWGVADGKAELQSCGPKATPPSASCRKGLEGGGAGEFSALNEVAVDNDPASPSHHDLYVLDGARVQKFDPQGNFLLTFGGGVIGGGAKGGGTLASGSKEITNVQTTAKAFEAGQTIAGTGIPAETRIVALGPGTITLSRAATASGSAVALSVTEGAGNVPLNEVQVLELSPSSETAQLRFSTPNPSPSSATTVFSIKPPPPASGPGSVQQALESLPNIGAGNVSVSGPSGGPYTIEFDGPRFADTDVSTLEGSFTKTTLTQDGASAAEVCTAAIAASCAAGIRAGGHGQLSSEPHLAIGPGGTVYLADCGGDPQVGCEDRLQKFTPAGAFVEELALPQSSLVPNGLAVDSGGDFYVSFNNAIRRYDPTANLLGQLPVGSEVGALALDAADNLFSAEDVSSPSRPAIAEYDPTGHTLRRFGYDTIKYPHGLAPSATPAAINSAEGDSVIERSFPAPGPLIAPRPCKPSFLGNTKATLLAEVNPEGKATTMHFEYVDQKSFEKEGGFASPKTKTTAESESIGSDFFLHDAETQAELVPSTEYRCRAVATNADVPAGIKGEEGAFTSKPPLEFGTTIVSGVSSEAATLNATLNPLGIPTTGYFEYVEAASYEKDIAELGPEHGFDHAARAPGGEEAPIEFGSGESLTLGSAHITGLKPGTSYRFRLLATDSYFPTGLPGPTRAFRTLGIDSGALPDDRAWELVSPGQKNSAEVAVPGTAAGVKEDRTTRIQASSGSGEAITFTSFTSFGDPESAPATSQYLAKRSAGGWSTDNIAPYGTVTQILRPPYSGFDPDLDFAAVRVSEPALAPGCPEGYENLYLRDNASGTLRCLTPEAPDAPIGLTPCLTYAGASADASHVFFAAPISYAGAPQAKGFEFNLYEWFEGKLRPVSILPGQSEAVAPTAKTSFGAGDANCQWGVSVLRHVVSADGSRAFWTYVSKTGASQLLVRINAAETIQLDAKAAGGAGSGEGKLLAASADGSVAYFTDTERLISGAKAEAGKPDLYRYQLGAAKPLTDLTKGSVPGDVKGLLGASDDGSYAYFVAGAVLSGEEENGAGAKAAAGKNNLYLFHEGKTTFIATLSDDPAAADLGDWETQPKNLSARVSPDGRHLAFLSVEAQALAGYDNTIASGEHCLYNITAEAPYGPALCPQAFIYDADTGKLTCASCNPSGARPLGRTVLPGWANPYEGPRYLSDDGQRLFFESFDTLSAADENAKSDIYEFELEGAGSCTAENPAFDPASGGCHFLISSGRSEDASYLVDASSDGRDVFFSTRSALTGWDTNENFDVYDARAGGGFPEPTAEPVCGGEGCLSPPPPPPAVSSPPHFEGPGNQAQKPKPCGKGRARKHGRCTKPSGRHHTKRQGRPHQKGRAGK